MDHKIYGERFMSRDRVEWHKVGTAFSADEIILPSEAAKRVAGDVRIEQRPLKVEVLPGNEIVLPDQFAIMRMPTDDAPTAECLGVASGKWHPINYVELARALDRIDQSIYKLETAGLLDGGRQMFLCLRGEDWSVLGKDEMQTYFNLQLSVEPGVGHRIRHTPVRVVCWNTQMMAEANSKITLNIQHSADAAQQIGLCGDLLVRFREAQAETKAIFEMLAQTPAPIEDVERVLAAAWPEPTKPGKLRLLDRVVGAEGMETFKNGLDPAMLESLAAAQEGYEKSCQRVERIREAGMERYEAFEPAPLRGTLWAAYNAVTEIADWRGNREQGWSVVSGSRAAEKARAFTECMAIVKN